MDEDIQDGPFAVWQMFNAPTMVLFNNLENAEEGLDRLLTSILKLSGDLSEVLVPRYSSNKYSDSYYCEFNTWLIGRLFYVWSVKELNGIHILSKNAQLKILNILCMNGASFHKEIHTEYFTILSKLVKYYENSKSSQQDLLLEHFKAEQVHIPDVELDLQPIFVTVKNIETCKMLIELTLDLLSESIPLISCQFNKHKKDFEEVFANVLKVLESFSTDMKLVALNFFTNFIINSSKVSIDKFEDVFPEIFIELLYLVESLVKMMNIFYEEAEVDSLYLEIFNETMLKFLQNINKDVNDKCKDILINICTVVLLTKSDIIFKKEVKLLCLSYSNKVGLTNDVLSLENKDASEIDAVANHYKRSLIKYIELCKKSNKRVDLENNWYYKEVSAVIKTFNNPSWSTLENDTFLRNYHIQRFFSVLKILLHVKILGTNLYGPGSYVDCDNFYKFNFLSIWKTINIYASMKNISQTRDSITLILDIITTTAIISENESGYNLTVLRLGSNPDYSGNLPNINNIILTYMLVAKITNKHSNVQNFLNNEISIILQTVIKVAHSKEMITCCPLLLITKTMSSSKIIGDILIPAFHTKLVQAQAEIARILPAILCMSIGSSYRIVLSCTKTVLGYKIFSSASVCISVVCDTCHSEYSQIKDVNDCYVISAHTNAPSSISTTVGLKNLFAKFLNHRQYTDLKAAGYWTLLGGLMRHFYVFSYGVTLDIIKVDNIAEILKVFKPLIDKQVKNDPELDPHKDTIFNMCIDLLVKSTQSCLEGNDFNKQSSNMDNVKEFGLCHNNQVVLPATKLLVYYIMHPQCTLGPKAVVYLRDVCEYHGYTPNQVYHRFKKDYCRLFVDCSLYNGKDFAISLLLAVRAFGFFGYRDFISKDVHHFLPYLIPYSVTIIEVPSMIEEIASLVQCTVSDFLIERFPHIYVHIYLNETDQVSKKCYQIIEQLTKSSILNLIKKHFRVILTEFLLQYCCNPDKVLNACRYLACHDPDVSTPTGDMSMSTTQIADFLNPKFLGVLAYFDHKLVNAKVALSVKRKALKSFPDIMQLMGVKYLTPLRFKVIATLRSALPLAKEFPKIVADAWGAFIHNIDTMSLGPLLSNLAVSLLKQLEHAPQEINKIFQYLVLNNENLLSSHISDLFFLGDSKISDRVKIVIKMHVKRTQPDGFLDQIKWYLQHLNQEISVIRGCAFSQLDKLLKGNRTEIHKAIFGGKMIDPVVVELIDSLLMGCKDPDPEVSAASGACLGQLGAIEAGHLPRQYVQPDRSPFAFSISENCFAATALVELARAFQYEKDTTNMDCYALTIQEILKIYDISPTGAKKHVWDSFPEHIHQIMFPLLSSRYTLAYPSQPKKAHPLFGSTYATTFLEWAHNWAGQLIHLIESESIRELLRTVHPSMRRDVRTLFLFLPYVLLHAVMSKTNPGYVQEEILAVIGTENLVSVPVSTEKSRYKMLRHIRMTPNINTVQAEEGNQTKCSKMIYTLMDFLNRWLLEWCHLKPRPLENENYKAISTFMEKFDKLTIARGNFLCGELERALQYLEMYMAERQSGMQDQLPFLAEIYALLDEPDSVAGILSIKRSEPSLKELILAQVVTGRLQDAALCYERLAQEGQLDRHSLPGMVDCYLGLDQPFTAYRLLSEHERSGGAELSAEPLWRLGRWEQLDAVCASPVPPSRENWGLLMGRILLAFRSGDQGKFDLMCDSATSRLLSQMDGESRGESALRSGYQSVLGLHIVTEARHAQEVLIKLKSISDSDATSTDILDQLLDEWRRRLSVVQTDVRTVEPLLRLRRIFLQQTQESLARTHPETASKLRHCIGDLWLQSAKQARKAGILQQSYMYILNAEEYQPEELFIEKAKMYWSRGQHEQAFTTLRRRLDEVYPQIEELTQEQRKICAKAKLLIAKYNDETTNVDVDVNIGYYKEAVDVFKQWEKSLVCLGAYYEKVSSNDVTNPTEASMNVMWSRRLYALNSYGKALQYGHKYLYQSMPRMLSIWLDVEATASDKSSHMILAQMTEVIKTYSQRLPQYLYLTAFSQIVSRICHPVKEVYQQLKAIIVKLILAYPQHTLWMMMSVIRSGYPQRIKRCNDVFSDPRLKEPRMLKLVCDFTQLAEKLTQLCNNKGTGEATTVSSLVRTLPRLLASDNFSHIMMPFQQYIKLVLPSKAARRERLEFNIPVDPPVYIAGIEEHVSILPSLQKPRKVTLKGSDGKPYIIMLKPNDDLRKDYRLMEFNAVVNRFLQDAPETRRRRLYIRTYSVLPLNEECGLIEWVPNLVGLRPVLMHIYKQKGIHTSNRELKDMMCSNKDPIEKKRRIFEQRLLPRHPPVFNEWFQRVFADPYGWYQARSAYVRTTAVMSMVGYILGLGDRHGENISFDSTNGDTVHVDFNCLFNKGEAFEWPERVPFRLTHNMEAAMGPLKHEGMYRKSCEAVMKALRAQTAALMSVIGPFVYDPLVSWTRSRVDDSGERTNEQAMQHLNHIRQRLNGMVRTKNKQLSLSLSPEGQVEHLIVEATSIHNLCQMYIGWGPFL